MIRMEAEADAAPSGAAASGERISLLRYSPALILLAAAIASASNFADTDLWWHLRFGAQTLALGHAPTVDTYSYSAYGHVWRDHEWLATVILALVYRTFGVFGLRALKFACAAITMALLAAAESETGASAVIQMAVLLAVAIGLGPFLQIRPQTFDFVILSALLLLLTRENYRRRAPVWLAVPLMMAWANLHGAFPAGIATLGVYTAAVAVEGWFAGGIDWPRVLKLAAVTLLAAAATLVNPYGIGMWKVVLISTAHSSHSAPSDWQRTGEWSPTFQVLGPILHLSPATFVCMVVTLVATAALAICVVLRPRGGDFPLLAIAALMTAAGMSLARSLSLEAMAVAVPLARHAGLLAAGSGAAEPFAAPPRRSPANELVIVLLTLFVGWRSGLFSRALPAIIQRPADAVAFMRAHDLHGNVLSEYDWSGYLIWHDAPRSKVFLDPRFEMAYPVSVMNDYTRFITAAPGAPGVLQRYPHDYVLVSPDLPAYAFMTRQPDWCMVYCDGGAALFARAASDACHLAGAPFVSDRVATTLFP
jgi:hypothetical protein